MTRYGSPRGDDRSGSAEEEDETKVVVDADTKPDLLRLKTNLAHELLNESLLSSFNDKDRLQTDPQAAVVNSTLGLPRNPRASSKAVRLPQIQLLHGGLERGRTLNLRYTQAETAS